MMASLLNTFNALDMRKKIVLGVAVLLTILMVLFVARTATQPSMALLYGGLDPKAAGEVTTALDQLGVATDVRGDAIYVPEGERDRARMELAQQNLPAQGQAGYELLDNLTGFGTTSEMFEAAYWRAKEGELARTIAAVPGVRSARVHIGASARRPFARSEQRSSAAVTVNMQAGPLQQSTALSIRYLTALAVADLDPSQVAVIDARHGVILRPGEDSAAPLADETADRRSLQIKQELEQLIGVRVGDENVRVSVTVETTRESQTVSERIIDPESRVTMNAETEEMVEQTRGTSRAVTVASNLPDGDEQEGADNSANREQTRETISYNYSQTERSSVIEPGAVKRLGVAVLVDEQEVIGADGETTSQPRSAEELATIEALVKSAIAFNADRGDVVTVESMRFAPPLDVEQQAEAGLVEQVLANNVMTLIQGALLAAVALAMALFVVRPILLSAAAGPQDDEEERAALGLDGEQGALAAIGPDGELIIDAEGAAGLPAPDGEEARKAEALAALGVVDSEEEQRIKTAIDCLREAVSEKTDESVALLKRWLHAPTEAQAAAQAAYGR
ncbi:MAG: flagellar basal-body MS-ring/collar protein FliF [Pseudomonadota bacterium]